VFGGGGAGDDDALFVQLDADAVGEFPFQAGGERAGVAAAVDAHAAVDVGLRAASGQGQRAVQGLCGDRRGERPPQQ
jgi:hypothetical protein